MKMKKKLLSVLIFIGICYLMHIYTQNFTSIDPNADLLIAGKQGWHNIIVDLIRIYGADINSKNDSLQTPLMLAAIWNNLATIEQLLSFKPQLDLQDKNGNTAMILAINPSPNERITKKSHIIVQRLLEHGANPLIKNLEGKTVLDLVTIKKAQDEWTKKTEAILRQYIFKLSPH